jgi:hypothetical protein
MYEASLSFSPKAAFLSIHPAPIRVRHVKTMEPPRAKIGGEIPAQYCASARLMRLRDADDNSGTDDVSKDAAAKLTAADHVRHTPEIHSS